MNTLRSVCIVLSFLAASAIAQTESTLDSNLRAKIDRSLFTENGNSYFSEQAIKDFASGLDPLGPLQDFSEQGHDNRGGMIGRTYRARFAGRVLIIRTYELPNGKWEQFQLAD